MSDNAGNKLSFSTWKRATDYARFERGLTKFISVGSQSARFYYTDDESQARAKSSQNYRLSAELAFREVQLNPDLKVRAVA